MNRNYLSKGGSTAHILKLFDRKAAITTENTEMIRPTSLNDDKSSAKLTTNSSSVSQQLMKSESVEQDSGSNNVLTFNVLIGKRSSKKHKTWDEDGFLEVDGSTAILKDLDGKYLGKTSIKANIIIEGFILCIGNKEIQIIDKISPGDNLCRNNAAVTKFEPPLKKSKIHNNKFVSLKSSIGNSLSLNFKPLLMPHPDTELEDWLENDVLVQDVSVDACLASVLRPHQRQGLVFLYRCVMGMNESNCHGAILADEMGLGKTLQCVALVWTLLKQGPYGKAILKRVLIVAPSSLCDNWNKEFVHWLGHHRISPFVVEGKKKPRDFLKFPKANIMIISYEMFVRNVEQVVEMEFDMLICDEGHRLKNSELKSLKLLSQLNTRRRIILTGTPVQNDLQEFYTLVDFVNPGILDSQNNFKKYYEQPIIASQNSDATDEIFSLGQERARELHDKTKAFIIRRTNNLINKYLPKKYNLVIFCRLTNQQDEIYSVIIDHLLKNKILYTNLSNIALASIIALKKVCNHPYLFMNEQSQLLDELRAKGSNYLPMISNDDDFFEQSGKLRIVRALLQDLRKTSEKVVLISYYTQTLDILEKLCYKEGIKSCRLDGTTATLSRTKIVETFNLTGNTIRVFLLSAKAGGIGLNLTGASRLILFDSDWNPASDAQAMARIWRDGQKRSVYIYRLLTTGTIEEKIYQRQISKTSLSESVIDANHLSSLKLSTSELKDLFTLIRDTNSLTHDLIQCNCQEENKENQDNLNDSREFQLDLKKISQPVNVTINQLRDWEHFSNPIPEELLNRLLLKKVSDWITFIFYTCNSHIDE